MSKAKLKTKQKKDKKIVTFGRVYILSTFNNTIVTITDSQGGTLAWSSGKKNGFKGAKKSTPYAGGIIAKNAAEKAIAEYGIKEVDVFVRGPGSGRDTAIRAIDDIGIRIKSIKDETSLPHNGCRPKKKRRV